MHNKFQPRVESLEGRDVPASFSFLLPDGTVGSGQFATPDGVDSSQSLQAFEVADVSLALGGEEYTAAPIPFVYYANGLLLGVAGTWFNSDGQIDLMGVSSSTATFTPNGGPSQSAPVVYDAAEAATTFTLSDGTAGAISFRMPWESVNAALPTQSLSLQNFNLNLAGRNFTVSDVIVNAAPTVHFEFGQVVGVTFDLGLNTAGFPYSAVSMLQDVITATLTGGGTVQGDANYQFANADSKPSVGLSLAFPAPTENYHYELTIKYGDKTYKISADIQAGSPAEVVRDTIFNALQTKLMGSGLTISKTGTTGFNIQAPADKSFTWGDESSQMVDGKKMLYTGGPTKTVVYPDA